MVVHWITGRWDKSLKGWIRTPRGRRAFFNNASVSGILDKVDLQCYSQLKVNLIIICIKALNKAEGEY